MWSNENGIFETQNKIIKDLGTELDCGGRGDSFGFAATKQLTLAAEVARSGISPKQQKINGSCG
jgi:hypothetical protein